MRKFFPDRFLGGWILAIFLIAAPGIPGEGSSEDKVSYSGTVFLAGEKDVRENPVFGEVCRKSLSGDEAGLENAKIRFLLEAVKASPCLFLRNGKAGSGKDAARHLGMKYKKGGRKIRTALEFIDQIGSQSSMTGKAYQIRILSGEIYPMRIVFLNELRRLDACLLDSSNGIYLREK